MPLLMANVALKPTWRRRQLHTAMAVGWVVVGVLTVLGAFYNVVKCIQMDNVRFFDDISPSQVLGNDMNM